MAKTKVRSTATSALASLLAGAANGSAAKSKSSIPLLNSTNEGLSKSILSWIDAKVALEAAEAAEKIAASEIREPVTEMRINQCRADGKIHASIRVAAEVEENGKKKHGAITLIQQGRFLAIPNDPDNKGINLSILQSEFAESFDRYFQKATEFTFKAEDFTEEELNKVIVALGESGIKKLKPKAVIKPTEAFLTEATLIPKVYLQWQRIKQMHGICQPWTPSIRK